MKNHRISSDLVEAAITALGGHLAPVRFYLSPGTTANPYSLPPWRPEDVPEAPPVLRVLRGDFFCFPFGESENAFSPHGETANAKWEPVEEGEGRLILRRNLLELGGTVEKRVHLRSGHRAVYQEHVISGVTGHYNYGHHPILAFPEGASCPVRTSPFKYASVYPGGFADRDAGERDALRAGARFDSLYSVPLADGGETSLARYPARAGCEDLVMLSAAEGPLAWTAVTFPGYVWVALRSVESFPSTLLWMSNGGRPQPPWESRHVRRLGVEDVCSWFHEGTDSSEKNHLRVAGIPTVREFQADRATHLRHIQFVHPVARQSGLAELRLFPGTGVVLLFEDGHSCEVPLEPEWLLEA